VIIDEPELMLSNRRSRRVQDQRGVPYRDDPGDIIDEFDLGLAFWRGLAWDGELAWGIDTEQMQLVGYDTDAGEIAGNIELQMSYFDLTYDGEEFWAGTGGGENGGRIHRIDRDGNITGILDVQSMVTGVTFDGENLWYFGLGDWEDPPIFRQISTEGELLVERDCSHLFPSHAYSMAYVPEHNDGNLWVLSSRNLYQVDINMGRPRITQQIDLELGDTYGICHDGWDLLYNTPGELWYKIDDGIWERRWIDFEPQEGVIEADEEMEIFLLLDSAGLIGGLYEAELRISSNDPNTPEVVVLIFAEVFGSPFIQVEWHQGIGFPDIINWNRYYENVFSGAPYLIPVEVRNLGTDVLVVEDITCENEIFSCDQNEFELAAGDTREITFILNADENGRYESEMVIFSNSFENPELSIPLVAETITPPEILIEDNAIVSGLLVGEIEEHIINIANDGEFLLRFFLDHDIIIHDQNVFNNRNHRSIERNQSEPRRDEFGRGLVEYNLDQANIRGIAWDGELIWCVNPIEMTLFSFNPETEEITETIQIAGRLGSLDFDGEFFWAGGRFGDEMVSGLHRLDRNGNLLQTIEVETPFLYGMSHDGENLLFNFMNNGQENLIRQVNSDGELIREIDCNNVVDSPTMCLEWVSEHENGNIWTIDYERGSLIQLDVSDDAAEVVKQTEIEIDGRFGITHDGANLWYITGDGVLKVIDDGIHEETWITYVPVEGELEPDEDRDITLILDATDLEAGIYSAELHIYSNDPVNPDVIISVTLQVEPDRVDVGDSHPVNYSMSPAYPNPFNSTTIIKYTVPIIAVVNVGVYDLSGRLVQTLVNEKRTAGEHKVVWSGTNHSNGVYIIYFDSGEFRVTRKVTLIK